MEEELFNPGVYSRALELVQTYVIGKSGILEDAQDIFHEGLMIFFRRVRQKSLRLTSSPELYILGICKKLWLKRKPNHESQNFYDSMDEFVDNFGESLKAKHKKELLMQLMEKHIKNLSEKCKELLNYRQEGLTCEEIAQKMGLENDQVVRNTMYRCKRRLWKLIDLDPEYKHIIEDE